MKPVNLEGNCVHDGLTVGGAVVEKYVEQRLVGKVTQASSAGQGDFLYPPDQEKKIDGLFVEHFGGEKTAKKDKQYLCSMVNRLHQQHNIVVLLLL